MAVQMTPSAVPVLGAPTILGTRSIQATATTTVAGGLSTLSGNRIISRGIVETKPVAATSLTSSVVTSSTYAGSPTIIRAAGTNLSSAPVVIRSGVAAGVAAAAVTVPLRTQTNISLENAANHRETFVKFIKQATSGVHTPEYKELYRFLQDCFTEADSDFDGRVGPADFDIMVEHAGSLPRKFGFAPTSAEMFATLEERVAARQAMFQQMNTSGSGYIAFDEWLTFCYEHICQKAKLLDVAQAQSKMETSAQDFSNFIVAATSSRGSSEYKELYHFLLDCFTKADSDHDGRVGPKEFDAMIEIAAAAPRRFGFAPPASQTFQSEEERIASRTQMFANMDVDNSGFIAFDEWLIFCYNHICEKAQTLVASQ